MTIEDIMAQMFAKRAERLKLQAKADLLEEEEKALAATLTAKKATSGQYGNYFLKTKTKPVPRCPPENWPQVWAYVRENNAFDLLHKRLTETAVMARINGGESVPGIVTDDKTTYTVSEA
jgi:hypothetical protein